MWRVTFLIYLLVAINNRHNVRAAPTSKDENHLNDGRLLLLKTTKFSSSNSDPIRDIPGEPLSPADFRNAKLLPLEPPLQDMDDVGSNEIGGLFEGDIAGVLARDTVDSPRKKGTKLNNAVVDTSLLWPSGIVPYVISASFGKRERSVIAKAILEYQSKSCLRFVPRSDQDDYLKLMSGDGCSSFIGRIGGEQQVSLGRGCFTYVGIVMHELMHAVGFWHEQSRPDRDDHVIVHWANIQNGMEYNFQKYDHGRIQNLGVPYDTGSIMHYEAYAFAKNSNYPTISSKKNDQKLGQREGFSDADVLKLNRLYQCKKNSTLDETTSMPSVAVSTELPVKGKSGCADDHKYCKIWMEMGECERNPWMIVHCRQSCNRCDVSKCDNYNANCTRWAETGECLINSEYMNSYCRKSCGLCETIDEPSSVSRMDCVDDVGSCRVWADGGQCQANPDFMLVRCRKSCREC